MPQPVQIDQVMEGGTVSEVVASNHSGFQAGRRRARPRGLADAFRFGRQGPAQDRREGGADLDRAWRARHAGHDRVHGPARHRQAAAGRDGGGCRGLGRGRLGGRPDREDQGRACDRHRRRRREVQIREGRARLRRLRRSSRSRHGGEARRRPVRRASTSISRMSAARCSRRCCRCSTRSRAFRCAA